MGEHHSIVGDKKIAVIGLGYVGLPLARLFATRYAVVGFDINQKRIAELRNGVDSTLEVEDEILQAVLVKDNPVASRAFRQAQCDTSATGLSGAFRQAQCDTSATGLSGASRQAECDTSATELSGAFRQAQCDTSVTEITTGLYCSSALSDIQDCTYYIVTVPTPVDKHNKPDLTPLYKASETVGKVLKKGDVVIYESTVYPGATEEECIPVLERVSGLQFNVDFFAGYSPERINPGDKEHTVEKILKVTSGSTPEIGMAVDALYSSVITAGTHLAPTIKVAEAAKVIENSQRDINIAFVNELAKIFNLLGINTHDVLTAAGTKWNFLPFKPGLVGGHCIGVDPYYLAQKAQEHGYHPEIILAGRRLNDSMGEYVASQVVKTMIKKNIKVNGAKVLNLGITFKENCPDVRNTKAVDVITALQDYGVEVVTYDPWANPAEVEHEYKLDSINELEQISKLANQLNGFDAIILTVAHKEFTTLDLNQFLKEGGIIYDVKGILAEADNRL